jgi:hypothetical protein
VRHVGNGAQVVHRVGRVGDGLDVNSLGLLVNRRGKGRGVRPLDELDVDAQPREGHLELVRLREVVARAARKSK